MGLAVGLSLPVESLIGILAGYPVLQAGEERESGPWPLPAVISHIQQSLTGEHHHNLPQSRKVTRGRPCDNALAGARDRPRRRTRSIRRRNPDRLWRRCGEVRG